MEQPINFQNGMIPQLDVLAMPEGAYIEAVNMMRDESGTLITEVGTENCLDLGAGSVILGMCNLGDDIAIASIRSGVPEIGVLDISDTYTSYVSDNVLGFSAENKVRLESKIDYAGSRVIYIAGKDIKLRSIDLDNIEFDDFDRDTSLFIEYDLPLVNLSEVTSGGKVLSGIYQFCARLVTGSNNTTPFGPISGTIPVGSGVKSSGRKNVDGAEPQTVTANSVVLEINNVDTSFEYIEPCVITYIGQSNQLQIKSLGKIQISNRENIVFAYSGTDDEYDTVLAEELNIDGTYYESASYIQQKDNTLLLAGLSEKEDTVDWQEVANSIVMKFVEKPIPHTEKIEMVRDDGETWESLSDSTKRTNASPDSDTIWTDNSLQGDFEDYKNPKTCAEFKGYRRDEVYSFTFTPVYVGGRRGDAFHIPALTEAEVLSLGETSNNLLGLVETSTYEYPDSFGSLSGQKVRYHKMPSNDVTPYFYEANNQQYVNAIGVSTKITLQSDWMDGLDGYIIGRENRVGKETILAQGFCKDIYEVNDGAYAPTPSYGNCAVRWTDSSDLLSQDKLHKKVVTFHSPDLLTDKDTNYVPSKLTKIGDFTASYSYAGSKHSARRGIDSLLVINPGTYNKEEIDLTEGFVKISTNSQSPDDDAREGPNNDNLSSALFDVKLEYRRIMECVALKATVDIPRFRSFIEHWADDHSAYDARFELLTLDPFEFQMYNIEVESSNYYGDIYDKEALPVNTIIFSQGSVNPINGEVLDSGEAVSFEGDTFISRYAVALKTTGPFYGTIRDEQDIPKSDNVVYVMVESSNNYNYRHYNIADDINVGSTPYYPKYKILYQSGLGINNVLSSLGNAELYNKQYSAQNVVKSTFSKSVGAEVITEYPNRIAYSSTSIEGEKFDAFRLFLTANYHDIPKQFGIITGLFVQGNDLYAHTERSLWRCFYNTLATQATSEGDIVLGNGGAFPRPSIPILTVDGGYAGCKDIDASIGTPAGRYFVDAFRSKAYYFGDTLKEISNPAIFELLRSEAYNSDFVLGYDYGRKRVMLSSPELSLSYKPELNSFSSKHMYQFDNFISRDMKDYLTNGSLMDYYSKLLVGTYFGSVSNSTVKFPIVVSPALSKRFTSLFANMTSFRPSDNKYLPKTFFDRFRAYSFERNTDWSNLEFVDSYLEEFETLGRVFVHKANNKFRLAFPPDLVYDIEDDIFKAENLKNYSGFSDDDRLFLPDLTDNHLVVDFIQDNNNQRQMKINSFIVNFEQNIT